MPKAIILTPEAEAELHAAYWWYEDQDVGLGDEFFRCVEAAFSRIGEHPQIYPIRFDDFRRILVRRFPYAIYFEYDEDRVLVHCVFQCAQHPDRLRHRFGC